MTAQRLAMTDVAIIGLGAAGGMAAMALTRAGLEVVALEAGDRLSPRDFASDEIRNDIRNWMGRRKFNHEIPTQRTSPTETARRPTFAVAMGNAVGGSSINYAAFSWRLQPWNFHARRATVKRYGAAAIPAGSTLVDWPLCYQDLEPYYDRAERLIGVAGRAGNIRGRLQPGGNPFEGPRAREYPMPPLRRSGYNHLMEGAARRLGWHPFPAPAAIATESEDGRETCTYCGFCNYNGCYTNAKGSVSLNVIPAAERTGHLRTVTRARVLSIATGRDGRVTGVVYVRGGRKYFQPAKLVVLSAFTYENTRLLLVSRSRAYPKGLANRTGQVGRHAMTHVYVSVCGSFAGRRLNRYSGPSGQSVNVDDWAGDNFDHRGLGFVGGGTLGAPMEGKPIGTASSTPPTVPRWGSAWKAFLKANGDSIGLSFGQIESLPYEDVYFDLDPHTRDAIGMPVIRITYGLHQNEQRAGVYVIDRATEWLKESGAAETWIRIPPAPLAVNAHVYGGTRMGDDPDHSVVDRWCLAHDAPNLAILGASTWPTCGGHNPALTIQALALRTADHIVRRWEAITS